MTVIRDLIVSENNFLLYDFHKLYDTNHYTVFHFQNSSEIDYLQDILSPSLWHSKVGIIIDITVNPEEAYEILQNCFEAQIIGSHVDLVILSTVLPKTMKLASFFKLNMKLTVLRQYSKELVAKIIENPEINPKDLEKIVHFLKVNRMSMNCLKKLLLCLNWDLQNILSFEEKTPTFFIQLCRSKNFLNSYANKPHKLLQLTMLEKIIFELGELPGMKEYFLYSQ